MLIKIIFSGIVLSVLIIFLKRQMSEFVLPVEIIFLTIAASAAVGYLQEGFLPFFEAFDKLEYGNEIFSSAVKGTGICLITRFSSDICAENGNRLISDVIEFAGRIMLLIIAVPYIETVINIAFAFLK